MYIAIFLLQFHLKSFTCTSSPSRIRVFTGRKLKNIVFSNLKRKFIYFNNSLYNTLNIKGSIFTSQLKTIHFFIHFSLFFLSLSLYLSVLSQPTPKCQKVEFHGQRKDVQNQNHLHLLLLNILCLSFFNLLPLIQRIVSLSFLILLIPQLCILLFFPIYIPSQVFNQTQSLPFTIFSLHFLQPGPISTHSDWISTHLPGSKPTPATKMITTCFSPFLSHAPPYKATTTTSHHKHCHYQPPLERDNE